MLHIREMTSDRAPVAWRRGVLLSLVLGAFLVTPAAFAHQDPPGCTAAGVSLNLSVFRSDGSTSALGEPITECETVVYRGEMCHPGGNACNIENGTLEIITPDGVVHDVTPGGGPIPKLTAGNCVLSEEVTYTASAADADAGQLRAILRHEDGLVHSDGGDEGMTAASVDIFNPIEICDDGDACNGLETCDPDTGSCVTGTPPTCDDGDVCNGNETCNPSIGCVAGTPLDCDDGSFCTDDTCDPDTGCQNTPVGVTSLGSARAYGVAVRSAGSAIVGPAPDSNVQNPDELASVPAGPLAEAELLAVEESTSSDSAGADASARATTADVRLIDTGSGNWLVTATSVQAEVACEADVSTAACTTEGSILQNVVVNGEHLGTVAEPVTIEFLDGLGRFVTVNLLERVPQGANDGRRQPGAGRFTSGLAVNGIHVTVGSPFTLPLIDVVVAHAEAFTAYGNDLTCREVPHVSGHAAAVTDGGFEIGRVDLPSTGGSDEATLAHVGPVTFGTPTATALESNTAFAHTEGVVDESAGAASSASHAQIEDLELLDSGSAPTNPFVSADLIRAECESRADGGGIGSTAYTRLLGLSIGGTDVCASLDLEAECEPPPNTEIEPIPGIRVLLNEQFCDAGGTVATGCVDGNDTGITVNAVRIFAGTQPLTGINVGANLAISQAHCDAGIP